MPEVDAIAEVLRLQQFDMKRFGLIKDDAHNKEKWRSLT